MDKSPFTFTSSQTTISQLFPVNPVNAPQGSSPLYKSKPAPPPSCLSIKTPWSDNSPGYGQNDTSRKPGSARFGNPPQIKRIPTADIGKTVQWIGATAQELGDSSLNQPKTGKTEHCPFLFSIIFFFLYICKKIQFFSLSLANSINTLIHKLPKVT